MAYTCRTYLVTEGKLVIRGWECHARKGNLKIYCLLYGYCCRVTFYNSPTISFISSCLLLWNNPLIDTYYS